MMQNETVTGVISCQPNEKNQRDLDISIVYDFKGQCMQVDKRHQQYRLR